MVRIITGCKIMLGKRYYFETLKRGENRCALFIDGICGECIKKTTCLVANQVGGDCRPSSHAYTGKPLRTSTAMQSVSPDTQALMPMPINHLRTCTDLNDNNSITDNKNKCKCFNKTEGVAA